jgi:hypothetical protein
MEHAFTKYRELKISDLYYRNFLGNFLDHGKMLNHCWDTNVDQVDFASFTRRSVNDALLENINAIGFFVFGDFWNLEIVTFLND